MPGSPAPPDHLIPLHVDVGQRRTNRQDVYLNTVSVVTTLFSRIRLSSKHECSWRAGSHTTEVQNQAAVTMDMKLEVLVLPVCDVDRAKAFYEKLGFRLDIDAGADDYRVLQFTPPGSDASIIFGKGVTCAQPGSIDRLLMTVPDINAARRELISG